MIEPKTAQVTPAGPGTSSSAGVQGDSCTAGPIINSR